MIGILLINLGTPKKPTTREVRKYLREFLSDPLVIDINPVARWILVNTIIAPFRSPKSAKAYAKIWSPQGSPLLVFTQSMAARLQNQLGPNYTVAVGMRYGEPSIANAINDLINAGVEKIRAVPLYPQYALSTTESSTRALLGIAKKIPKCPEIRMVPPFFNHLSYIEAMTTIGKSYLEKVKPDHVLFSFHGLPERHVLKTDHTERHCLKSKDCCNKIIPANAFCYRAQSFETARLLANALQLSESDYSICFQSRLGRAPWIQPYTRKTIVEKIAEGKRNFLVFCPSFVTDCLETLEEIALRERKNALALGGAELTLVPSLNDHPAWIKALCEMIE